MSDKVGLNTTSSRQSRYGAPKPKPKPKSEHGREKDGSSWLEKLLFGNTGTTSS